MDLLSRMKSGVNEAIGLAPRIMPVDLRRKKKIKRRLKFLLRSQWFPEEWHIENQCRELRHLISFAKEHSSFYREQFKRCGIKENDIRSPDQLRHFPIISRQDIEANPDGFKAVHGGSNRAILKLPWYSQSSTGFPIDEPAAITEEALLLRHWDNCGYKVGRPAIFVVNDQEPCDGNPGNYDAAYNWHRFALGGLADKNLGDLCHKMKAINAEFIFGYPGALELLADSILQWGIELTFQGVVTGWEILTDLARSKLEKAFDAKVYDWYGLSFPGAAMGQCHYCDGYHLFSEQGILEIVNSKGEPISKEGETGRIIITNFSNRAFPLIRYDTGDLAVYSGEECRCGRGLPSPATRIVGRSRDMLTGHDGRYLEPSIFHAVFSGLGIAAADFRLVQTGRDNFSVTLVQGPRGRDEVVDQLRKMLTEIIGGRPSIEIDIAERIRSEDGKTKSVERRMADSEAVERVTA
jgi:phenylacetate-CoA ligase